MIEDLDLESVENLCKATGSSKSEPAKRFFEEVGTNSEVWISKLQRDFPDYVEAAENRYRNFWIYAYKDALKDSLEKQKRREENLFRATFGNNPERVEELLDMGVNPNIKYTGSSVGPPFVDVREYTPLILASAQGCIEIVKKLCEFGADIKARSSRGHTALMVSRYSEISNYLLTLGADINTTDKNSESALLRACRYEREDIVKVLLNHPTTDVNAVDKNFKSALLIALKRKNFKIVKLLLNHPDININLQNNMGTTPLIQCINDRLYYGADLLLKHPNINVNLQDSDGNTALMYACMSKKLQLIRKLLNYPDINVNIRNKEGKTAFLIAASKRKPAEIFQEYGIHE